ncbi:MAG: hypothetical protein M3280_10700 [Actinomycetota bacterium]|nr:hypothetical protein [Actinomycetota bacterium]
MTLLLGGSILLIAGSGVALVLGWLNASEGFIWTSIGATAGAAVLLALAYFRSSRVPAAATAAPEAPSEAEPTQVVPPVGEPTVPEAETAAMGTPVAEAAPAEQPAVASEETVTAASSTEEVVAIPRTKKFHRTDCRFAGAQGGERMTRGKAESEGYAPCGTCKP